MMLVAERPGFSAMRGRQHLIIEKAERLARDFQQRKLVIDHEDLFAVSHRRRCRFLVSRNSFYRVTGGQPPAACGKFWRLLVSSLEFYSGAMTRGIYNWTYRDIKQFLKEHGFSFHKSLRGSHELWIKLGENDTPARIVEVNFTHKSYPPKTLKMMIYQSGIPQSAQTVNGYNSAGKLVEVWDALNQFRDFTEAFDGSGQLVKTYFISTNSGAGVYRIATYYRDGQRKSITGDNSHPVRYEYGPTNGGTFTKEIKLNTDGSDTSERTMQFFDTAGRPYKTLYADGAFSHTRTQPAKTSIPACAPFSLPAHSDPVRNEKEQPEFSSWMIVLKTCSR